MDFSDLDIVDAYVKHGSVWKAGEALGLRGQIVHQRLTAIGAMKSKRLFTEQEKERTREYYANTPPLDFSLDVLAKELGRSRQFICRQAGLLGLTSKGRPISRDHKSKIKLFDWSKTPHPRGALGTRHSDETKEKVSKASLASWERMKAEGVGNMSEETRQSRSDTMSKMRAQQPAENAYSRTKMGRRDDLGGMFFRSSWEANYARYLNWLIKQGEIDAWEYETETFWFLKIKRGVRSYKPDFKITEKGETYFVEVKGWMDEKSKTKLKRMKKYYPAIRLDVVDAKQYARIKTAVSRLIEGWE